MLQSLFHMIWSDLMRRLILEMGMGNDLYGMDYTKASKRAVEDARPLGREGPVRQILDEVRPRIQGPHDMSVDALPR